jgi:signal transduction histidine kinase
VARIFDPFFTTKDVKRGMGIGLKICRDIVHGHGGVLRVESGTGGGTRVVMELPGVPEGWAGAPSDGAESGVGTYHA